MGSTRQGRHAQQVARSQAGDPWGWGWFCGVVVEAILAGLLQPRGHGARAEAGRLPAQGHVPPPPEAAVAEGSAGSSMGPRPGAAHRAQSLASFMAGLRRDRQREK